MGVHVARVGVFNVDALGNILKKDDASITIKQQLSTSIEHLIVEDAANSNTSGNPTVKQYLELEAASDYIIAYMDQSTIVTKLATGGGGGEADLSAITQDILPAVTDTYDVGSSTLRFAELHSATNYFDLVDFNNTGDPDLSARQLAWNDSEGALALGVSETYAMFLGEEMHYRIKNDSGSLLRAGTPVYATGLTPGGNNRIEVGPYTADGNVREIRFMGLMTENCDDGDTGYTTHFGYIRKIDTRGNATANGTTNKLWAAGEPAWVEGDILYVHPTIAGKLTKVEPQHSISVAIILNVHENNGKLFVRPTTFGHLEDNHDVNISSPADNDLLIYDSASSTWVNEQLDIGGTANQVIYKDATNAIAGNSSFTFTESGTSLQVDNLKLDGNTISTTDSNGNLIISADGSGALQADGDGDSRGVYAVDLQKLRSANTQIASGNFAIVVGGCDNTASGDYSVVGGGEINTSSGVGSTVGGGYCNTASGGYATTGGGRQGTASGFGAVIAGGQCSTASGYYATVSGGRGNTASGFDSTVSGGYNNTACEINSTVSGGCTNIACGNTSTVGGGHTNTASGYYATIGGGRNNSASAFGAVISGGQCSTASGYYATVSGGRSNIASGFDSTVSGGYNNTACEINSTVSGGYCNTACGNTSTVGGGRSNTASGYYATVSGGKENVASGFGSAVGGGQCSTASGYYATVSGGSSNLACVIGSSIGGGCSNTASGYYANVSGGCGSTASGSHSTVGGGRCNTASGYSSTVGGGYCNIVCGTLSAVGGGSNNTVSGSYSTLSGGTFNCVSGSTSTVGGGYNNTASGYSSTVVGGSSNRACGTYSTVGGGHYAKASKWGELAHAAGRFAAAGDAQHSILVARKNTTDATANVELFLDGSTEQLVIPAETTWVFSVKLSAYNDTDNTGAWWIFRGGVRRDAANGTALLGSIISERDYDATMSTTAAQITADDTNESLKIDVTGIAGKNIRWVAVIDLSQVSWETP